MNKQHSEDLRGHLAKLIKPMYVEKIIKQYEIDNTPGPANDTMARQYIATYEKQGIQIHFPDNFNLMLDWFVSYFGYDDREQLKRADSDLLQTTRFGILEFKDWRGGKICMSGFEDKYPIALAGNLIYKTIEPKLTDAQKAKKREAYKSKYNLHDPETLKTHILEYLKDNRKDEYTQDDIAREFCAKSDFVYHRLQELVKAGTHIVSYKSSRYPKNHANYKNKTAQVYKYSMYRVKIINDYANIDMYVQDVILRIVTKAPGYSQSQIVLACICVLGQIDDKIIRRNLVALCAAHVIVRQDQKLKRAAHFYMIDAAPDTIDEPIPAIPTAPKTKKSVAKSTENDDDNQMFWWRNQFGGSLGIRSIQFGGSLGITSNQFGD